MKQKTAIDLISCPELKTREPQVWVDLGSGTGTFTQALAGHLVQGSEIYAVDQDAEALARIPSLYEGVRIHKHASDFGSIPLVLPKLDGILMANSLHYIKDKRNFIQLWEKACRSYPCFLIVEYDALRANPWVPYPVNPDQLTKLFLEMDYRNIVKLREIPSLYHNKIYATFISK